MSNPPIDLRTLARTPAAFDPLKPASAGAVPRPRSRWRTRVFVPLVVIGAAAAILAYAARDAFSPRVDVYVAAVVPKARVMPAGGAPASTAESVGDGTSNRLGPVVAQAPGWVEPAPYAISVAAQAEGIVREVLVLEGERVEAGQVVARLIDDDAKLQVRSAAASVAERSSDVRKAEAAVATAESQVPVEQAALAELRDEVTRKRGLLDTGGVSAGEFRRLELRLVGLEAKVASAERFVDEARAALEQAQAGVEAAAVARDEAQLRLARMEVRAPVSGVVLARLVEPGTRISMSSKGGEAGGASMSGAVLRLYDPEHLQVRVDVPLADAAKIGVGMAAQVTTEALPDQTMSGVVTRVMHEANIQRNTVQFKVSLDSPPSMLKPEMLTRVKLHATVAGLAAAAGGGGTNSSMAAGQESLLIPESAVANIRDGKGAVWLADTSSGSAKARLRDISTAPSAEDGYVIVVEGLRLTDRVVLNPPPSLRDGTLLRILGEPTATSAAAPAQ